MKQTILFMVTNGAGLGHLTRGLAVARRMRQINSELEIIFLTTSLGVEIIRDHGFMFYYLPTRDIMPKKVGPEIWNEFLKRHLQEIVDFHQPTALVFDGAFPYAGLVGGIRSTQNIKSFWIKRECYKGGSDLLSEKEAFFDFIVSPKEMSLEERQDTAHKKYCDPIMIIDQEEAFPRELIRNQLGVPKGKKLIYVQLGATKTSQMEKRTQSVLETLHGNKDNYILLGESPLGKQGNYRLERVRAIRNYPNAIYFNALDGAISASGYNTVHELMYFGIPTVFIPNQNTGIEDSVARAQMCELSGAAICLKEFSTNALKLALDRLMQNQAQYSQNAKKLIRTNGAKQAALYILEWINTR